MEKFIIEKEDKEAVYLMYADEDGDVMVEGAYLTPYIEPDREKAAADAFQRGYEHAKHECADCRKIRADTEQELADNAYQRGLNDAWDAARTLWNTPNRKEIFGHTTFNTVLTTLTAQETIEKIRQYEQSKVRIGDEVENTQTGAKFIVTHLWKNNRGEQGVSGFNHDCSAFSTTIELIKKTGRYFSEISEVLKKMREDAPT